MLGCGGALRGERLDSRELRDGLAADPAIGPALGVEIAALAAAVVHLAREELRQHGAEAEDGDKNYRAEESVFQKLARSPGDLIALSWRGQKRS